MTSKSVYNSANYYPCNVVFVHSIIITKPSTASYLITLKQYENKEEEIKNGYSEYDPPECGMWANEGAVGISED